MYKVFLNDRIINIGAPGNITLRKTLKNVSDLENIETTKKWFIEFVKNKNSEVFLIQDNPGKFFTDIFCNAFKKINAAGGIVKREDKILFILRNNTWDLPKGKIDEGEKKEDAAIREVAEECGIDGHRIVKTLPSTYHIYQSPYAESKGQWILKEIFWFEMEYLGKTNGSPQLDEGITELKWFDKNELQILLSATYSNLRPIVSLYLD